MTACVVCASHGRSRPVETGHVCQACLIHISDDLHAILDLASWATIEPVSGRGSGRTIPASRPPINVDGVSPELTVVPMPPEPSANWPTVLELLESWERLVREAQDLAPYGIASAWRNRACPNDTRATLTGVIGFLAASLDWWATSPDQPVEDFASEVHACRRVLARWDPDREPLGYVAYCPTDECGARLRYHSSDEDVTCPRCRVTRDVPQLVAVVLSTTDVDIWADCQTAALHYGVSQATLRRMVDRGDVQRRAGRYLIQQRKVLA